ncbi:hypothetical protein [Candidatus Methanomassiliicoccus intestinalis]|uniref:hypothetical protein n=1 Tax=Candidatus Methanomassiliicoccus intestinalis TaxID=1406512 RepID=UPI0037DDADAC
MKRLLVAAVICLLAAVMLVVVTGSITCEEFITLYEELGLLPFAAIFLNLAVIVGSLWIKNVYAIVAFSLADLLLTIIALFH